MPRDLEMLEHAGFTGVFPLSEEGRSPEKKENYILPSRKEEKNPQVIKEE